MGRKKLKDQKHYREKLQEKPQDDIKTATVATGVARVALSWTNLEYQKQFAMSYLDQCTYLQNKYGLPSRAYFLTPTCKSKTGTKISRTSEGLVIHHLKENYFPDLSKTEHAILQPWEYQEPLNLVYCNYI